MNKKVEYKLSYTPVILNRLTVALKKIDIEEIPFSEKKEDTYLVAYSLLAELGKEDKLINEVFRLLTGTLDKFDLMEVDYLVEILESFFTSCGNSFIKFMMKIVNAKVKLKDLESQKRVSMMMEQINLKNFTQSETSTSK